jgi:hypothetical protein
VRVGETLVPADILRGWPVSLYPALALYHGVLKHSGIYRRHRAKFSLGNEDRKQEIQRWIYSEREDEGPVADSLRSTLEEIGALIREAQRGGFELRFLVLPELAQATPERWEWYVSSFGAEGAPPRGTPASEPTDLLCRKIRELGGTPWDFTPEMSYIASDIGKYLLDGEKDKHWSKEGHAAIAFGILRRIQQEGLVSTLTERRASAPRE